MDVTPHYHTISRERRAGILLHPTSLPGPLDCGDIGHQAYRFIEFLSAHGLRVWQMLPVGPTHEDKSPYQCLSSHAGNPLLISLHWLEDRGWLSRDELHQAELGVSDKMGCLKQAGERFMLTANEPWQERFTAFKREKAHWLDDYALFMALKAAHHGTPWYEWPSELRQREAASMEQAKQRHQQEIEQVQFEQFIFFSQWHELHDYAKKHQVELYGDLPLFVSHDSADVWAQRENFLFDEKGEMTFVAGVPPDAFSETGQRWGNPLFDWDHMQAEGFQWWKHRVGTQLELFDLVRVDHFRGIQASWYIPSSEQTATNGRWVEVPGRQLLEALHQTYHCLPLIAEDLGVITDEVIALKKAFRLPGMKVLQFAFDGNTNNPHLPHNHHSDDTIYTGTHDNDTTLGWASNEDNYNKAFFIDYANTSETSSEAALWTMIRLALSSVSFLAVIPMQDLLLLDSRSRMNTPGTTEGNWQWRFEWQQLSEESVKKLSHLITLYQR